jgi:hypothetical protein
VIACGTRSAYVRGCRCFACTEANRVYGNRLNAKRWTRISREIERLVAEYDPTLTDFIIFGSRTCSICGADLPASSEYFAREQARAGGLTSDCRLCRSLAGRRHYRRSLEAGP